jgi:hypothetical protein
VFVHDIISFNSQESEDYSLQVTKYSFFGSTHPFNTMENGAASTREMILHYTNFEKMGLQEDAEFISVKDIKESHSLEHLSRDVGYETGAVPRGKTASRSIPSPLLSLC